MLMKTGYKILKGFPPQIISSFFLKQKRERDEKGTKRSIIYKFNLLSLKFFHGQPNQDNFLLFSLCFLYFKLSLEPNKA